nr:HAMP domain-containing sensor histidine kinase [Streptomyces sulfonofaciens]
MPERGVPLRRSLLVRLLAVSVLVSVCSIAATAWVVVRTTAVAIGQERGQALADDARIYDALIGYAATHPRWDQVAPTVAGLAGSTGHRIVLLDKEGRPIADSDPVAGHPYRPPDKPTALIDPLAVDPQLLPAAASDGIDPRAVGPYRLSDGERSRLEVTAGRIVSCLRDEMGVQARIETEPGGRPRVIRPDGEPLGNPGSGPAPAGITRCSTGVLDTATSTEAKALKALNKLVNACLAGRGAAGVRLALDGTWTPASAGRAVPSAQAASCLGTSRSQQLAPYVAPVARLYVSSPGRTATTFFDLSAGNKTRIAGGAALVLLVTVAVTTLAGIRLVRPLRALTQAARRMEGGDISARVAVTGRDEIARLSTAFNAMSARRARLESVRKAMTSDVAHELRTPLSNIRGWLEAVEDGVARPDSELVALLLGQARLLQHIIDDLRDLSEADAGELRLSREPVEVAELLAATAMAHRASAEAAGVRLTVAVDPSPPLVVDADRVRLRQAVGNLVSNAIRHTPAGGRVVLRSRREGDAVAIEVADTGAGIAPGELPHVFDRFWRAEKSRSRRGGGSGLGLSIVRKLTEAHGGTVSATSTPGKGSRFVLRIPAPRGPAG